MSVIYRFSKEVCRCRASLGMTQEQLAEALSISVRWLQYIEAGERVPSTVLALRIIALLGINGKDLRDEG